MKRDLNLIRGILVDVENYHSGQPIMLFEFDGKEQGEIAEHVQLLLDAEYIEAEVIRGNMGLPMAYVVLRMTWAGHEFLAKAKNDTIWKKVMAQAEEKGLSTSMAVVNGLLEAAAKKYAGLE